MDSLAPIRRYVDRIAAAAGLDRKAAYRLRLAVDEIATNVVTHGYQEAGLDGDLYLQATIDEGAVTVSLEDTGAAYDPGERDLPGDLDLPLEQRSVGGLGVFLTLTGVDEFRYSREGGRNRNLFVMRRALAPEIEGRR